MQPTPLTFRQERFVFEFLKDQNASAAAARAGYTARNMAAQGNELMNNPAIRERVRREEDLLAAARLGARQSVKKPQVLSGLHLPAAPFARVPIAELLAA